MRVLLCGESWVTHSLHIKGVDSFTTSSYVEGADHLRAVLTGSGIEVDYLPGHLVPGSFPASAAGLAGYAAVILSDIGANSILLAPQTFERSQPAPDRLAAVESYVAAGGGLLMIGGYLSFAGIEGKARYHGTPVEDVLPVLIADVDDRVEVPQGVVPEPAEPGHPVLAGVPGPWPAVLGYNRVTPKPGADVVVRCGADPLIACGRHRGGRSAVFTSDCAPHWAPPAFMEWPGYAALWPNLIRWLAAAPPNAP
jgi:uncharacterized membrane protein